jgi:hypothetical protein
MTTFAVFAYQMTMITSVLPYISRHFVSKGDGGGSAWKPGGSDDRHVRGPGRHRVGELVAGQALRAWPGLLL